MKKDKKLIIFSSLFLLILIISLVSIFILNKKNVKIEESSSMYSLKLDTDVSKDNIYYININNYMKDWLFENKFKDSFNEKIHPFVILQEFINVDDTIEDIFITINTKNEFNAIEQINKAFTDKYGGTNIDIENINIKNTGFVSYMHAYKSYEFENEFDKDYDNQFWGINEYSESLLVQAIKINYYFDENNYSVSIFDKNNNELILIKNNNYNTYKEAYEFYANNKNTLTSFIYGKDNLYIKNLDLKIFSSVKDFDNIILINNDDQQEQFENYYVSLDFKINGYSSNYNKVKNYLDDKEEIKYNFKENTILFIKTNNEINPYFAMSY